MPGGFLTGQARAGDAPGSPVSGGGDHPDPSRVRFRASAEAAPTTPALPIDAPSPPSRLGVAQALRGANALLLWDLVPPGTPAPPGLMHTPWGTDFAWRWQKHAFASNPTLGSSPYMSVDSDGLLVRQAPIASGGGSYIGSPYPLAAPTRNGPLVDVSASPVWTMAVEWESECVMVNGDPPPTSSSGSSPPILRLTQQPIIGNVYTNGPWVLYCNWSYSWIGGPGAWSLVLTPRLVLLAGGSGGPTTVVLINGKGSGTDYVEFDSVAKTIRLWGGTLTGVYDTPGDPLTLGVSPSDYNWPGDFNGTPQIFCSSNMGPYYWASYRQLNGHLAAVAAVPLSAEDTVALVSQRSLVPGTGPVVPSVKFRSAEATSKPLSAELGEYTHYWPLDDKSPGPMYDLLAGAYLTVANPSGATFQVDGFANPVNPSHTEALRLTPGSYLNWGFAGPRPALGTGAVGHDLTIGMWVRWEGPTNALNIGSIFSSTTVPHGFGSVVAFGFGISGRAEPFGVIFSTWDSVASTFFTLKTSGFDWPAEYLLDAGGGSAQYDDPVPYKGPVWAYVTVVLRTVSGHMTMEIWVDGVLLAQQAGSDNGWGADVSVAQIARSLPPATIKDLTIWPFALSPDAISGAGVP